MYWKAIQLLQKISFNVSFLVFRNGFNSPFYCVIYYPIYMINLRSHELRSKLLSLEMIHLIVQNFNTQLLDTHSFIYAIRHFLCVALTHNAVSPIISVFSRALDIFVQLVNKYKVGNGEQIMLFLILFGSEIFYKIFLQIHLKRQLEVFFKEIIISILDSSSSSFEHKWAVLNTIAKIFDTPQSVVDIYVNYDCHMTSANIFEELVTHLAKISVIFNHTCARSEK